MAVKNNGFGLRLRRLVRSLLHPRVLLHPFRMLHYWGYSHVLPRLEMTVGRDTRIAPTASFRNGARITRPSQGIAVGDILTIPLGSAVRLVEVLALPERRGPAREAQACYRALDQALDRGGETDIGDDEDNTTEGDARP